MAQELQKQSNATLTFQRTPAEFLTRVATYLETLQKVYRTKLPADELVIWRETLKDYSYQEFEQAMTHLITNPPKYQLDDGSIQVWRGLPKLPDVVDTMLDLREQRAIEWRRKESERESAEFRALAKRRDEHPEEFIGIADVLRGYVAKSMPDKPEPTDEELARRRQEMINDFQRKIGA